MTKELDEMVRLHVTGRYYAVRITPRPVCIHRLKQLEERNSQMQKAKSQKK
jgi:hypothetical protein